MQEVASNRVSLGAPLTVTQGVAFVVGAEAAMNRVKPGVRVRGVGGARSTHVSQGG